MNEALAVKRELHKLIDNIPERGLYALRPLLNVLADAPDDDVLSDEEKALLLGCQRDVAERPGTFISLDEYKKSRGLS
jgi:hypothetical protein